MFLMRPFPKFSKHSAFGLPPRTVILLEFTSYVGLGPVIYLSGIAIQENEGHMESGIGDLVGCDLWS